MMQADVVISPWNRVIDPDGDSAERNEASIKILKRSKIFAIVAIVMMIAALTVAGWPASQWIISSNNQARIAAEIADKVEGWPYPRAETPCTKLANTTQI